MSASSLTFVGTIGLLLGLLGLPNAHSQPPQSEDAARAIRARQETQRRMLLARMPIPEAARLAGDDYVVEQTIFEELVPRNLASLASESELVVVGRVAGGVSFLSPDKRMISTAYQVHVVEAPKDAFVNFGSATDQMITVIMPGGKIDLGDGVTAELRLRGKTVLTAGDTCVLFLEPAKKDRATSPLANDGRSTYVPRLGSQGVFRLAPEGVKPHGQRSPLVLAFADTPNADFIARVRAAVR